MAIVVAAALGLAVVVSTTSAGAAPGRAPTPAASAAGAPGAPVVAQVPTPTLPEPEPDPGEVRDRADEILSADEYRPPEPTWFDRVLEWIGERLEELFSGLGGPTAAAEGGGSTLVAWGLIALLVAAAIFLVVRARGRRRARDAEVDDPVFVSEVESRRTSDEWLDQAARHEAAGEWKAALRCRYRALVAELIDHGVVRDLPGRTSGEFRLEVRRRAPALDDAFTTASGLFDAAFYGDRPTGAAELAQFQEAAAVIAAGLRRPAELAGASSASGFVAPGADG